jgi:hypothetical protein
MIYGFINNYDSLTSRVKSQTSNILLNSVSLKFGYHLASALIPNITYWISSLLTSSHIISIRMKSYASNVICMTICIFCTRTRWFFRSLDKSWVFRYRVSEEKLFSISGFWVILTLTFFWL